MNRPHRISFRIDAPSPHQLAREVLNIAASHVRPGITTDEIDEIVHNETIKRNAYPSPLNYRNFPKSVCTFVPFLLHFFWVCMRFIPRSVQLTKLSATESLIRGSCEMVTLSISVRQYCFGCVARSYIREDVTLYYEGRPGPRPSATII